MKKVFLTFVYSYLMLFARGNGRGMETLLVPRRGLIMRWCWNGWQSAKTQPLIKHNLIHIDNEYRFSMHVVKVKF